MHWTQVYDPFGRWWLSTLVATLPILVLFGLLVGLKVKPHWCAISGATTAAVVAVIFFKMPWVLAVASFGYGVALHRPNRIRERATQAWVHLACEHPVNGIYAVARFELAAHLVNMPNPRHVLRNIEPHPKSGEGVAKSFGDWDGGEQ